MTINGLLTETTRHYVPPDRTVYEVFKKKKIEPKYDYLFTEI